jgi:hypothetical protein
MSLDDGLFHEMPRRAPTLPRLDDDTADRLLAGELPPLDAPPGYAPVATLLRAAAAPPRATELAPEDAARRAFVTARPAAAPPRRRRSTRLAVLVVAGVLCLGGVAAAATGTLPDPVQAAAHTALQSVGVSVPAPHSGASVAKPAPPQHHTPVTPAPAPRRIPSPPLRRVPPSTAPHRDAPPHARPPHTGPPPHSGAPPVAVLLCRAAANGRLSPHGSPAMQRADAALVQLAGGAANIPGYCRGVLGG